MATKGTILVGTIGQGVMMSSDDGESWSRASVRVGMHSDAIVKTLLPDPRRPATVYAGTDLGLYQTDDGGGTWRLCDTPMKSVGNITPVLSHRRAWPGSSPAWHSLGTDEATPSSVALAYDEKNARKDVRSAALRDDSHGNHR